MTKRQLAAYLCKREGGKSQAKLGDVMQLLTEQEELYAKDIKALQNFLVRVANIRKKRGYTHE